MRAAALSVSRAALLLGALVTVCADARYTDEMGARIGTKRLSAAAEGDHTCLVRADGNIVCWGNNASGQIGDGTSGNVRSIPTLVSGIATAVAVAAGKDHTCALLAEGAVQCWGTNAAGQLGVGSATASSSLPRTVPGLSGVVAITAGTSHTCARLADGTARCWGANGSGRLGDGTTTSPRFTPVAVSDLTDIVEIVAGATHTCALQGGGAMSCWGANGQGQLGTGDLSARFRPTPVTGIASVTEIRAGLAFTCALSNPATGFDDGGQLFCWGDNDLGQVGGTTASNNVPRPTQVPVHSQNRTDAAVTDVAGGQTHGCASVVADGILGLQCWGGNDAGQLGLGSTAAFVLGLQPVGAFAGAERPLEIAAARKHTCELTAIDIVRCWGDNTLGQLGNDTTSTTPTTSPGGVLGISGSVSARSLGTGTSHSCAVRADGTAACWGRNLGAALGDGTFTDRLVPTAIQNTLRAPLVAIVGGGNHTCAATETRGFEACWGDNRSKQVNPSSTSPDFQPTPGGTGVNIRPVGLAAGAFHTCAVDAFASASCWGSNSNGQLAGFSGATSDHIGFMSDVVSVVTGSAHSCALRSSGHIQCWGGNDFGQLGNGTRSPSGPHDVPGIVNAVSLSGLGEHNCALLATALVVCWGRNDFGQADGTLSGDRLVPTPVTTLAAGDAVAVTTGAQHTCILTPAGTVRCWGRNDAGQLGNNTQTDSLTPVTVLHPNITRNGTVFLALTSVAGLASGAAHNCALRTTGQPFCWGRNPDGELGDNTRTTRLTATGVGSFIANIAPDAALSGQGRIANVTALVNCPLGDRFIADLTLTQGTASGQGRATGACTGGLTGYPVVVPAHGKATFGAGDAVGTADIVVHRDGEITDQQEWTRTIQLAL